MKTVQNKLSAAGVLFLLASCGDYKTVVEAPRVTLDPPLVGLPKAGEEAPAVNPEDQQPKADPLAEKQWALKTINAEQAWAVGGVGLRKLRVAILSSGVDYNHEDLRGNIDINEAENTGAAELKPNALDKKDSDGNGYIDDLVGWDVVDNDGFPFDHQGDGTGAAGIVGAVHNNGLGVKGVLGEVSIVPVRYIDSSGASSVDKLIEALRYVNSLKKKVDVVLIQLANVNFVESGGFDAESFLPMGGSISQKETLGAELAKLAKDETVVVVNAGNRSTVVDDNPSSKSVISNLATRKNVFLVTSVDQADVKPEAANFSRKYVLSAAPAVGILTTAPGNQYTEVKGTFVAAAHVAAAVTLAKAQSNKTNIENLRSLLTKGQVVPGLSPFVLGSSRLDLAKLISGIRQ